MSYNISCLTGSETMTVSRCGEDALKLELGGSEFTVLTEDLAALIRAELPKDRAKDLFSEIESTSMQMGKARVAVEARTDIKKGEQVAFTIDIGKYLDSKGKVTGIRVAPNSGLIF